MFVRIEASLAYIACSPNDVSQSTRLGFEQRTADVCGFRLVEDERVAITAVARVGQKERCDSNEVT